MLNFRSIFSYGVSLWLACCLFFVNGQIDSDDRQELSELNPSVVELNSIFSCKRLFVRDGTGQSPVGCGSDNIDIGDSGRLFEINNNADFATFKGLQETDRSILISSEVFADEDLFKSIAAESTIKNVLVAFSDDGFDLSATIGEVLNTLFTQPVFLLDENETKEVRKKLVENKDRDFDNLLWNNGVEATFYNGKETVTTEFCLDLLECDPIGGQSVWGTVGRSPSSGIETILLAVKLDTNGLFHDLTFGAMDTAGPLSVLLTIADTFSNNLTEIGALDKQIVFAAFQGESFDSIGSKRFIFDIVNSCGKDSDNFDAENDACLDERILFFTEFNNLDISDFTTVVVLDNVLTFKAENPIFIQTTDTVGDMTLLLNTQFSNLGLVPTLVPRTVDDLTDLTTIIQSFIDFGNFDATSEAIVITSYNENFGETNPFKFTRFDKVDTSSELNLPNIATAISKAIVENAGGAVELVDALEADPVLAQEIESCLTIDFACDLVAETIGRDVSFIQNTFQQQFGTNRALGSGNPPFFFPGVHIRFEISGRVLPSGPEIFTRTFLAQKLSLGAQDILDNEEAIECDVTRDCTDASEELSTFCNSTRLTSVACVQRKCICTSVFFHDAVSPAIDSDGLIRDPLPESLSAEKVFTEPRFELPTGTLFQHSKKFTEILLMALGVVFTLSSYFLVNCWVKKMSSTKFKLL